MNVEKDWKAKLESAYSFMLKYSKITVWPCKLKAFPVIFTYINMIVLLVVKMLVEGDFGMDINEPGQNGKTALTFAKEKHHSPIIRFLESNDATE